MKLPKTRKTLSPRFQPMTGSWAKLAFSWAGLEPTKSRRKYLQRLYAAGFSNKDAGLALKEREGSDEK